MTTTMITATRKSAETTPMSTPRIGVICRMAVGDVAAATQPAAVWHSAQTQIGNDSRQLILIFLKNDFKATKVILSAIIFPGEILTKEIFISLIND